MPVERHFLGWDAPAIVKVREFLLPQGLSGLEELGKDLIVVPTSQAGRRLREALARHCSGPRAEPLSLRVVTPPSLLQPEDNSGTVAKPLEAAAVWADLLMREDLSRYGGLFPSHIPSQDFLWGLRTGEMVEGLRDALADGGYSIADVYKEFGDILEELERWHDLAEMESIYLERLKATGLKDPLAEMLQQVKSPEPPKGVERIVVAAVPDPTPLLVQRLEQLSSQLPVIILVHAPESLSDCFDAWGRPIAGKWRERQIDIPEADDNILLSGSPRSQSRKVLELIAGEEGRFGPDDVAIGVPDAEVVPFLEADLAGAGLAPFDPAGKPAEEHPLSQLLRGFRDLMSDGDYPAVSALLRNSDVLDYLGHYYHPKERGLPSPSPTSGLNEQDGLKDTSLDSRLRGNDVKGTGFNEQDGLKDTSLDSRLRGNDSKEGGNDNIEGGNGVIKGRYDGEKGGYDGKGAREKGELWYRQDKLLEELDRYQNEHLPQSLDDMVRFFTQSAAAGETDEKLSNLAKAAVFLGEQVREFEAKDTDSSLRAFLQTVYEFRSIDTGKPEDSEFAEVAGIIDEALHLMSESPLAGLGLERESILEMLLWHLGRKRYYPEPEEAIIDLEGWMELPWNDAPFLIVTGMNDGRVPDSRPDDIFLPDTLRRQLKLRHDEDRLAVQAYQMTTLVESRREEGRVCFIAGKTGGSGDVLKPSRLLLRCGSSELPARAERLFGTPPEAPDSYPSSISFRLEAAPPGDVPAYRLEPKRLPVTAFRDYLACPFRFYLKRMLEMEELDDQKRELDAMDFGSLIHDVLYDMACDGEMRECEDIARLQDFLCDKAADRAKEHLGSSPPLQVEAQIESARQRLRRAAEVQAGLARKGWEIIKWERMIEGNIEGMLVRGKIDRVDRHRRSGKIRVLDYKTSEKAINPEEAHLGPVPRDRECPEYARVEVSGRQRRWTDLQLPLYAMLFTPEKEPEEPFELGYFNLPRTLNDTGVVLWEGLTAGLLESAGRCARGVVSDIRNRRFWPPSDRVLYDDFGSLFTANPALCVNAESFGLFMNRGRML